MEITKTIIDGVLVVEPRVFGDDRGFFFESWSRERYAAAGIGPDFVQDNLSYSCRGTLRGLHLQNPHGQGKLVQVLQGEVLDVAVDVRLGSPTFGKWVGELLSAKNRKQLYIPAGLAHGFYVTSETALFSYKCTDGYHPECELCLAYDDADVGIKWPPGERLLSAKDSQGLSLSELTARLHEKLQVEQAGSEKS